jgi:hypothetical protein
MTGRSFKPALSITDYRPSESSVQQCWYVCQFYELHTFTISGSQSQESIDHLFSLARLSVTGSPDESLS